MWHGTFVTSFLSHHHLSEISRDDADVGSFCYVYPKSQFFSPSSPPHPTPSLLVCHSLLTSLGYLAAHTSKLCSCLGSLLVVCFVNTSFFFFLVEVIHTHGKNRTKEHGMKNLPLLQVHFLSSKGSHFPTVCPSYISTQSYWLLSLRSN